MSGDILVVSNEDDIDADYVIREATQRGQRVVRLNTERLPQWRISLKPGRKWSLSRGERGTTSQRCQGVWWRRPLAPPRPTGVSEPVWDAAVAQWWALLDGLATVPGPTWVSAPPDIRRAEDKALQLAMALGAGFDVPQTTWTNDLEAASAGFVHGGEMVVKSVATAYWESEEASHFVFARSARIEDFPDASRLALSPVAVQERIADKRDVRVTVVGDEVLAAICDEPAEREPLDWRLRADVSWRFYELPEEVAGSCRDLVAALDLRFAGIDLLVDGAGSHRFCELNPNGEWGWLQAAGLPIAEALATTLTS